MANISIKDGNGNPVSVAPTSDLVGTPADVVASSDTGTFSLIALTKRFTGYLASLVAKDFATQTTLASINTNTPALGQAAMAASRPVVIASNQSNVPVSLTDVLATGNITTQNLVPAGVATAGSAVAINTANGYAALSVQVSGTYTGALTLQGQLDGTNWVTIGGVVFYNVNSGAASATIASATVGIFQSECSGYTQVRLTGLAAMTGTAVVTLRVAQSSSVVALDSALPAGASIIGALTANQSVNTAQINGVTPLMGSGVNGTGAQRVTLATDQAALTVAGLISVKVDQTTDGTTNKVASAGLPTTAAANAVTPGLATALTVLNIKASAGNVYGFSIINKTASQIYLQFYNTAGTPALGIGVVYWMPIAASASLFVQPEALAIANHTTGIGIGASTTATSTGTPATAPDVVIFYK